MRVNSIRIYALVLPALLARIASAQAHQGAMAQRPEQIHNVDAAGVARGHAEFKSSCGFCHGDDATGARAPDLVRSPLVAHDVKGSLLVPMIRNGRPDKGMPSFSNMRDDQLADIIAFLHNQATLALHSRSAPGNYPVAKLLTGNAEAGKAYFNGAGGCSKCHSVTGDLAGISQKLPPLELQQEMVYPSGPDGPKQTATVTLKDGTTYQGTVIRHDEFTISLMCQDGWYRSWPANELQIAIHDPLEAHRELVTRYTDSDMHNLFAYLETLK